MTSTTVSISEVKINAFQLIWGWIKKVPPIFWIFIVIFIANGFMGPGYRTLNGTFAFLRRASPLAMLAIGEMMVLASGGFDLSIGAIVTMVVLGSSLLLNNDPANAYPTIGIMVVIGIFIGLTNGFVVSYLKVPSFIATLGMMLLVRGGALYWVGGAPRGYLTENWRVFGRGWIENVPVLGRVPVNVIILIVIGLLTWYIFHKTNFGKQILAIGDNVRASQLSGVRVRLVRVMAFVISAVLAVIAGIIIGGYGGVNVTIGEGLEMQAIAACVLGGVRLISSARIRLLKIGPCLTLKSPLCGL